MSARSMMPSTENSNGKMLLDSSELLRRAWRFNRTITAAILFCLTLLPLVLLALWLDPVTITGVNGWIKPFKFLVSSAIYTATLTWLLTYVQGWRRFVQFVAWFVGMALIVENALIIMQVLRGTTSHFNASTPFNAVVYSTMGLLIFTVAFLNFIVAIRLVTQKMAEPVFAWSLRLGLLLTVAGMLVAILMTTRPSPAQAAMIKSGHAPTAFGAHSVGVEDGGPGLPLVGWSTVGGDLRIPHFVGLHGLQILPLIGWWLSRQAARRRWLPGQRLALVWLAGIGYSGLLALLTWQALRGQSIIAPDVLTLTAFALLIVGTVVSAGVIFRSGRTQTALG